MGGVGRVGIAALALLVAALALFFVGPMLLGIGDDNSGGGAAATATPVAEATASPEITPVPAPTPTIYVVKKGDTMSKIANKFDLTVEQLSPRTRSRTRTRSASGTRSRSRCADTVGRRVR